MTAAARSPGAATTPQGCHPCRWQPGCCSPTSARCSITRTSTRCRRTVCVRKLLIVASSCFVFLLRPALTGSLPQPVATGPRRRLLARPSLRTTGLFLPPPPPPFRPMPSVHNFSFSSASRPSFSSLPPPRLPKKQPTAIPTSPLGPLFFLPVKSGGEVIHLTSFTFYSPKQWPTIHQKRRGGRMLLNGAKDSGADSGRGF